MLKKHQPSSDPWKDLQQHTNARIALGRSGGSMTTATWLQFKLAHAQARDAVHCEFHAQTLAKQLQAQQEKTLSLSSMVSNRAQYLQRPDLGRQLDKASCAVLKAESATCDIAFIVTDGLSATAVHAHAVAVLNLLLPKLRQQNWTIAPIAITHYGRVAIQDEIGQLLDAKLAVILIGERPGLSSPDSLGAYLVYHPEVCKNDADRNCISNIRPTGLNYEKAADTLNYLITRSLQLRLSGIELKDDRNLLEAQ